MLASCQEDTDESLRGGEDMKSIQKYSKVITSEARGGEFEPEAHIHGFA